MTQIGCRIWNLGLLSVIFLTCSNILLTIRLLNTADTQSESDCPQPRPRLPLDPQEPQEPHDHQEAYQQQLQLQDQLQGQLQGQLQSQQEPQQDDVPAEDPDQVFADPDTISLDLALGRWDARRVLKMFDYAMVGTQFVQLSGSSKVTLATQTSLERLHSLVQVVHHWTGPVSVALYAAGDEWPLLQAYVRFLRRCYTPVRERVAFHMAFPRERMPPLVPDPDLISKLLGVEAHLNCLKPEPSLKILVRMRRFETTRWRRTHGYPQNHLRNVARKTCQTEFVFLTDVDIVPSLGLAQGLNEFLAKASCGPAVSGRVGAAPKLPRVALTGTAPMMPMCAFVVPTYELDERVRFPRNKTDLVRLANKGLARPFHHKVFIYNQFATNFSRWQSEVDSENQAVHVAYNVTNFEFLYEPFYVARDNVPPHDERFMGYGYTRNTQVYEMFVAGFQFQVLSPAFTVHWGLQSKQARPAWREIQNNDNRRHFEVFKSEVAARYRRDPLSMLSPKRRTGS